TTNELLRWWLTRLASSTDSDPRWRDRLPSVFWRDRLPGVFARNERAALEKLAAEAPVAELSPQFLNLLEVRLRRAKADAEGFLRKAQGLPPADFWLNLDLGLMLLRNAKPAEAVGFFRAALVARPDCSYVYNKLGLTLDVLGRSDEAMTAYRRAI